MPTRSIHALLRSEEGPLLIEVLSGEPDALRRYVRWLERRGDPRAEALALACLLADDPPDPLPHAQRLGRALRSIDRDWWALVAPGPRIRHCGSAADRPPPIRFAARCPMEWSQLERGGDPDRRHCARCDLAVYRIHSPEELRRRARLGQCVAVPAALASTEQHAATADLLGRPDPLACWARRVFPD